MIKAIFKRVLPTLRMEAGCSLSVVGVFLFLEHGGQRLVPQEMRAMWQAREIVEWTLTVILLAVGIFALLLPFVSCLIGASLQQRFASLSLAFSVFVLVCVEGWSASDALFTIHDGPRIYGVPWNGVLAAVALLELGILIYGGVTVLDDRPLLMTLVGTRNVDWTLLAINLGVMALVLILLRFWISASPAESALLALHLIFVITLIRAPSEPTGGIERS